MESMGRKFKKICVFCGSQPGHRKVFSDAATELGNELVNRKIDLVYGGGSVGLMGLISQRVFDGGCHVLGVIPKALVPFEISGGAVGDVRIVSDMHERKAEMAKEAEAFISLPGGYGTMEETMEMITWAQLGIHKKPVGLLNVDGYYDLLLNLFDKGVEEGFIKPSARHIVISAPTANELLTKMEQFAPYNDHVATHESWQMEQLGSYTPGDQILPKLRGAAQPTRIEVRCIYLFFENAPCVLGAFSKKAVHLLGQLTVLKLSKENNISKLPTFSIYPL